MEKDYNLNKVCEGREIEGYTVIEEGVDHIGKYKIIKTPDNENEKVHYFTTEKTKTYNILHNHRRDGDTVVLYYNIDTYDFVVLAVKEGDDLSGGPFYLFESLTVTRELLDKSEIELPKGLIPINRLNPVLVEADDKRQVYDLTTDTDEFRVFIKYRADVSYKNKQDYNNWSTTAEIKRLKAQRVILLGGPGAISDSVKKELERLGLTVERIEGKNRYETAACIAQRIAREGAVFDTAFIAIGTNFADALAASSYAAMKGQPILLTATNNLPQATKNAISDLGIKNTVVCGGPGVVSDSVFKQLPRPKRVYGNNRYLTALEISKEFMPENTKHVYVSTGLNFPDAIAGGVLAAKNNSGVLLVQGNHAVPIKQVQDFYRNREFTGATIFGGTAIVSSGLEQWFKGNLR